MGFTAICTTNIKWSSHHMQFEKPDIIAEWCQDDPLSIIVFLLGLIYVQWFYIYIYWLLSKWLLRYLQVITTFLSFDSVSWVKQANASTRQKHNYNCRNLHVFVWYFTVLSKYKCYLILYIMCLIENIPFVYFLPATP